MSRPTSILLIGILTAVILLVGCASPSNKASEVSEIAVEADFLPRPRFGKATPRPLGRFLLTWDSIEGADGYQLQMSAAQDFSEIDRAWTIRGSNLELPIEDGGTLYFRIRSFNETTTSQWSAVLEVKESLL